MEFLVETTVMVWLVVKVAPLDRLVALRHKQLVPLKVQAPLTY